MKASVKLILAALVVSSISVSSAYAHSSFRADEYMRNPQAYRLGDSDDLQGDQEIVDQAKICDDNSVVKQQDDKKAVEAYKENPVMKKLQDKRLLKYSI